MTTTKTRPKTRLKRRSSKAPPPTLSMLKATANRAHNRAIRAGAAVVDAVIDAGTALQQVKDQLPHGQWGKWVADNFEGSLSTADRYRQVAANSARVRSLGEATLREMLAAVGRDEPSKGAKPSKARAAESSRDSKPDLTLPRDIIELATRLVEARGPEYVRAILTRELDETIEPEPAGEESLGAELQAEAKAAGSVKGKTTAAERPRVKSRNSAPISQV